MLVKKKLNNTYTYSPYWLKVKEMFIPSVQNQILLYFGHEDTFFLCCLFAAASWSWFRLITPVKHPIIFISMTFLYTVFCGIIYAKLIRGIFIATAYLNIVLFLSAIYHYYNVIRYGYNGSHVYSQLEPYLLYCG
jgi:hypothetical protein